MVESVLKQRPDLDRARLERTRALMCDAIPDCLATGYEKLIAALDLPDPDDRHVLAAAIRAQAQIIVTFNLDDFPDEVLGVYDIEAQHPDDFVLSLLDLHPAPVTAAVTEQAADLRDPPQTVPQTLERLRACGLDRTADQLAYLRR